jgi:hypothetical protein
MAPVPIIALAVLIVSVTGSTSWAVRSIRAGMRDALDLTTKLAVPEPRRAADWPELRVDAVVFDPEGSDRVLVVARWPAHPEVRAFLVLEIDDSPKRAQRLLGEWRDRDASLSPRALDGHGLVLRRRHSNDAVSALVVRESS